MKATITSIYHDPATARAIETAVRPDNFATPKPLRVRSQVKDGRVLSTITGAQDIESLLATLDDLLLCLIAVDRLLSSSSWRPSKRAKP